MGSSIASRRLAVLAAFVASGIALFVAYLHQSWTVTVSSDGASNALQAYDMLHGDPTLHGWSVSDVSFYTTELPEYMLVESVHGLGTGITHISGALTYTLLVLMVALAARGRAAGWPGAMRALLAAGVMLAPQLGTATSTLLLSPDHIGTGVPLLLTFFVFDWGETLTPRRWYVPAAVGVLLAWTAIGDPLALVIGALPLAVVSCLRMVNKENRPYELMMLGACVFSVVAQTAVTKFIAIIGGWKISGLQTGVAGSGQFGRNLHYTVEGILQLFGADFSAQPQGQAAVFALLRLVGPLLLLGAAWLAVRRFFSAERLVQVLTVAIAINLIAYAFGVQIRNYASAREIAPVLPLGAVLIGRLIGTRLGRGSLPLLTATAAPSLPLSGGGAGGGRSAGSGGGAGGGRSAGSGGGARGAVERLRGAMGSSRSFAAGVALLGLLVGAYSVMLGYAATQPSAQPENSDLVVWLKDHHLKAGLGGYWQANSTTLDSGGAISVRAVTLTASGALTSGGNWEAEASWYNPALHYADFVVAVNSPHKESDLGLTWAVAARTGWPHKIYHYGRYTIFVWRHNIMDAVGKPVKYPKYDEPAASPKGS